jgi:hypothetical protein
VRACFHKKRDLDKAEKPSCKLDGLAEVEYCGEQDFDVGIRFARVWEAGRLCLVGSSMWLLLLEIGDSILRLICLEHTWKITACTSNNLLRTRGDHVYHYSGEDVFWRCKGREVTSPLLRFS